MSINDDGQPADHYSSCASISADGRFVTFVGSADNLAPNNQYTEEVTMADFTTGAVMLALSSWVFLATYRAKTQAFRRMQANLSFGSASA